MWDSAYDILMLATENGTTTELVGGGGMATILSGIAWMIYRDIRKPKVEPRTRESVEVEIETEKRKQNQLAEMVAAAVVMELESLWTAETEAQTSLAKALAMMTETSRAQLESNERLARALSRSGDE